jgi:hypothetical protein
MITYEDLLNRFSKMADDRLGAGGLLASDGAPNAAQDMPSHEAKELADLPDAKSSKLSFDGGKVKKGPEKQKINKNIFMTRSGDSTIKKAEEAFMSGFSDATEKVARIRGAFLGGLVDELQKHGFTFPKAKTIKKTVYSRTNPSGRGGFMTSKKIPHLSVARRGSAAGFEALPKPKGPNPLLEAIGKN